MPLDLVADAASRRRDLITAIKATEKDRGKVRQLAYEFKRDRCWEHLGESSMWAALKAGIQHQFGYSEMYLYKLAEQGEALAAGAPAASSGRALQQFANLNDKPEEQQMAFDEARAGAVSDQITEAMARRAVKPYRDKKKKVENTAPSAGATLTAMITDLTRELDAAGAPAPVLALMEQVRTMVLDWRTSEE